jgi:hypothetical protein
MMETCAAPLSEKRYTLYVFGGEGRAGQVWIVPCPTPTEAQAALDKQRRRKERRGYSA